MPIKAKKKSLPPMNEDPDFMKFMIRKLHHEFGHTCPRCKKSGPDVLKLRPPPNGRIRVDCTIPGCGFGGDLCDVLGGFQPDSTFPQRRDELLPRLHNEYKKSPHAYPEIPEPIIQQPHRGGTELAETIVQHRAAKIYFDLPRRNQSFAVAV